MRRAIPRLRTVARLGATTTNATTTAGPHLALPARCSFSTTTSQCYAESMQDRLRRKIWGTNNPVDPAEATKAKELATKKTVDKTGYVEATDARGLPIAGLAAPLGVWEVDSYAPLTVIRDTAALHRAVRRALVETLTLQANDKDLTTAFAFGTPTTVEAGMVTEGVDIQTSSKDADGDIELRFPPSAEHTILSAVEPPPRKVVEDDDIEVSSSPSSSSETSANPAIDLSATPGEAAVEAEVLTDDKSPPSEEEEKQEPEKQPITAPEPSWLRDSLHNSGPGAAWMYVPLHNTAITFALVKRILQLTGKKVSDTTLTKAKIVKDLLEPLLAKPRAAKLAEELKQDEELVGLGNVKLFESRVRLFDKEKMLGRGVKVEDVVDYTYEGIDQPKKRWRGHVTYDN